MAKTNIIKSFDKSTNKFHVEEIDKIKTNSTKTEREILVDILCRGNDYFTINKNDQSRTPVKPRIESQSNDTKSDNISEMKK